MYYTKLRRTARATRHTIRRSDYLKASRAERRAVKIATRGGF